MNLLKFKAFFFVVTLLFFCLGTVLHGFAESSIQCHCFINRSYNPADKFLSDEYILATSFNSLLANSFAIPKRQVVMIKMNEEVAQDDLLIGLKIAKITGIDIRKFIRLRKENNTWVKIVSDLSHHEKIKSDPLFEAIRSGISVEDAGIMAGDEIIAEFYQVSPEEIKKFRMAGLNEKEINLVYILGHTREQKPDVLMEQHSKEGKSWSEIAYNLGLEPDAVGKLILEFPGK